MAAGAERWPRAGVYPFRPALIEFLRTRACRPDGSVLSWVAEEPPGYPYPEAAGLVLALAETLGPPLAGCAAPIERWLSGRVSSNGAVGRDGVEYVFDTAMALSGLLARAPRADATTLRVIPEMVEFIVRSIEERRAVGPVHSALEMRWSTTFGPHLLKAVVPLIAARGMGALEPIRTLAQALLPLHGGGRFRCAAIPGATYVHSSCYAAEGLIGLVEFGWPRAAALLEGCALWLASIQTPEGGIPAWHAGDRTGRTACASHADVTAQAVRIWVHVDAVRFGDAVARALAFLARLQHPSGGILYCAGSRCANTWATVFTVQALDWAQAGRPLGRVI